MFYGSVVIFAMMGLLYKKKRCLGTDTQKTPILIINNNRGFSLLQIFSLRFPPSNYFLYDWNVFNSHRIFLL